MRCRGLLFVNVSACACALLALTPRQALELRQWPEAHPLRQMEALLTPELLYKMEDRHLSLERLQDMSRTEIGAFLRHPAAGVCVWRGVGRVRFKGTIAQGLSGNADTRLQLFLCWGSRRGGVGRREESRAVMWHIRWPKAR